MPDFAALSSEFIDNPAVKWIIFGMILLVIEVFTGTMWMLFAALASLVLAGIMLFGIISPTNFFAEFAWLLGLTTLWAGVLWKPLKKRGRPTGGRYSDIIGQSAVVQKEIKKGRNGSVRWSGTNMSAKMKSDLPVIEIKQGDQVWIHDVDGNILVVSPFPPVVKTDN